MRDLYSNILALPALAPAVQAAAATGASIDTSAAGALAFVVSTGAIAGDGAFGVTIQESADGTNWAAAPAASIQTNAPSVLEEDDTYRLGYIGHKRFARLSLTKASGTSIAAGAVAILDPLTKPVA